MVEFLLGVPGRLVALGTSLATGVSDILTAIGTRAPASTAVSNAVLTDVRVAYLDNLSAAPLRIKSIQRGTIYIAGGSTFNTVSLSIAVNTAKAVLSHLGSESIGNNISNFNIGSRLELVSANQIRGWAGGGTNAITIGYQVVEYY